MEDISNVIRPLFRIGNERVSSVWPHWASSSAQNLISSYLGTRFLYKGKVIELIGVGRYYPATVGHGTGFQVFFKDVIEVRRREAVAHQKALNRL